MRSCCPNLRSGVSYQREVDKGKLTAVASFEKLTVSSVSPSSEQIYRHDLPAIQQRLQDDINKLADWTSENRMALNAAKTKSLLVTGKRLEKKMADGQESQTFVQW